MTRWIVAAIVLLTALPALAMPEATPAELALDHGLVTARFYPRLPDTLIGLPKLAPNSIGLRPAGGREDGRDDLHLALRQDRANSFGAWLPQGRYRLATWRNSPWAEGPEIEVVAGRITDLGSLIEISLGGDEVVLLPVQHPEVDGQLDVWRDEVGTHLVSQEAIRWQPEQMPPPIRLLPQSTSGLPYGGLMANLVLSSLKKANRIEEKAQLRDIRSIPEFQARALDAMPPWRYEVAVGDQGELYFGAEFGRVRVRDADGRWRSLDTGTLADITAIERYDGRLLAGTMNGLVLGSDDNGLTWDVLHRFDREQAVGDIDRVGELWFVSTSHREFVRKLGRVSSVRATVYSTRANDFSDLAELRWFSQEVKNPFVHWIVPRGEAYGDYYYVEAYPEIHRLRISTGEWVTPKIPGSVIMMQVSPKTGAVSAMAKGFYLSVDGGTKWTRHYGPDRKGGIGGGRLHTTTDGWIATWRARTASTSHLVVNERIPGISGWNISEDAPLGCLNLLPDADGNPAFCSTWDGRLFRLDDANWVLEFSND